MGIYCETYKCLCVCRSCGTGSCTQSPETRKAAEVLRGVMLDKEGNVLADLGNAKIGPAMQSVERLGGGAVANEPPRKADLYLYGVLTGAVVSTVVVLAGVGFLFYQVYEQSVAVRFTPPEPAPVEVAAVAPIEEVASSIEPVPPPTATPAPTPAAPAPTEDYETPWDDVLKGMQQAARPIATPPPPIATGPAAEAKDQGNEAVKKGNFELARVFYTRAIQEDPYFFQGFNNLANTFSDTGEPSKAVPLYNRGLMIVPESDTLRFNRANAFLQMGQYKEAAIEFRRVTTYNPNDLEAKLLEGVCYFRLRMFHEAQMTFNAIIAKDPNHAEANYNLARTMEAMGKRDLADAYDRVAFQSKPELRDRRENN